MPEVAKATVPDPDSTAPAEMVSEVARADGESEVETEGSVRATPVIAPGCSNPIMCSAVGIKSANRPPARSRTPLYRSSTTIVSTSYVVCAVCGRFVFG